MAILFTAVGALAEIICHAETNRASVPQGDEVVLTVTAEGDVGWSAEFELPEMPGVRVYGGGTNQSMSFINGRSQTSVSKTYFLRIETGEDFTIGPVVVSAASKECRTDPIEITVTERPVSSDTNIPPADSGNRTQRTGSPAVRSGPAPAQAAGGLPGDDVFVTLQADRTEAWVGQQLVLSFRYYRRVQPWNNPQYTAPRTEGFWREDLGSERNFRQVVQGRAYNVTEIRYALFPTRAGDLRIEAAELAFPDDVFDRFFNSRRTRRGPRVLRTEPVTIHVKELPPAPPNYSGLVARSVKLSATVDRDSVPRGEPVGLKLRLESDGFLKGFSGLNIEAPDGARLHDAGESFQTRLDDSRYLGVMAVEKVMVPGRDGPLTIAPVEVSWFDAGRGSYRTARSPARRIIVTPSDLPLDGDESSGFLRSEIARLGQDLAFIHPVPDNLSRRLVPWTGGLLWWLAAGLPLALLAGWRLYLSRLSADRRDPAGVRRRRALRLARQGLATAAKIDDQTERLAAISAAVVGYVSDCLNRPRAAVGSAEIGTFCQDLQCASVGERLIAVLESSDVARYGGTATGSSADQDPVREVASLLAELADAVARSWRAQDAGNRNLKAGRGVIGMLAFLAPLVSAVLIAIGPALAQTVTSPGADPVRLVAEGNQAYTEGDLDRALELYVEADRLGVNDAVLHFNLGNTHARRGELGRAVVSFLRARRLDPRNGDIGTNLGWVRGHLKDLELSEGELPLFVAQLVALAEGLRLDEWGLLLVLLVWLTAGLIAWAWYREELEDRLRRVLLVCSALLLAVILMTSWRWYELQIRDEAVVVVSEAAVRSGPADSFPVLFQVHDGLTVEVKGHREGWARIGLGGEWLGWLPEAGLEHVRR